MRRIKSDLEMVFVINQGVVIYMSEMAAIFHRIFTVQTSVASWRD
jgi:hypothetical protein